MSYSPEAQALVIPLAQSCQEMQARPVDTADNEDAWAKNRRVDFIIIQRAPEPPPVAAPPPVKGKKGK